MCILRISVVLGVSHKSGPIAQLVWLGKGPPLTLVPEYLLIRQNAGRSL